MKDDKTSGEASVTASPPTSPPRRRARHQLTPALYIELAPEVHRHVANRMRRATPLNGDTTGGNTLDDEEQPPPRRGTNLKSRIDRTGASTVLHFTR